MSDRDSLSELSQRGQNLADAIGMRDASVPWENRKAGEEMDAISAELSPVRHSIRPRSGDSWNAIAIRELPDTAENEAVAMLQSWNLHVFMRAAGGVGRMRGDNPILPSDVIFVEPPFA